MSQKNSENFEKMLDTAKDAWYNNRAMKQNSPFSPGRNGAPRLIISPLGHLWRAECLCFARFFILPGSPRELEVPFY